MPSKPCLKHKAIDEGVPTFPRNRIGGETPKMVISPLWPKSTTKSTRLRH